MPKLNKKKGFSSFCSFIFSFFFFFFYQKNPQKTKNKKLGEA